MLINLSNHWLDKWEAKQVNEANEQFGEIVDLPFPSVDPEFTESQVKSLADQYFRKVIKLLTQHKHHNNAVHIMGEFTFCFAIVSMLMKAGVKCVVSTTTRNAEEEGNKKITTFNFVKFREYTI